MSLFILENLKMGKKFEIFKCDDCVKKRANTYYVTKNINKSLFDDLVAKRVQEIQKGLMQNDKNN